MAKNSKAPSSIGRIQRRETNFLQVIIFGLQSAAGHTEGQEETSHLKIALDK